MKRKIYLTKTDDKIERSSADHHVYQTEITFCLDYKNLIDWENHRIPKVPSENKYPL